jgi:hypothetical protein
VRELTKRIATVHGSQRLGVSFDIASQVNAFLNYNSDFSDRMRNDAGNRGVRWSF